MNGLNPADFSSEYEYLAAQQLEQERQRKLEQQRQQQAQVQQLGGVVGTGAGVKTGQSLMSSLETPNTAESVIQSAAPTSQPIAASSGLPQYSPVPTATEEALGFGASAPQGQAVGSATNGGFINGPVPAEPVGFGNSFGSALGSVGQTIGAVPWGAPLALGAVGGYTGYKALEGYKAGKDSGGALQGLKAGIRSAGPLNFVPVLGQAPAIAGLIGGAFGGKKGKEQRQRDYARGQLSDFGILTDDSRRNYITGDGRTIDLNRLPEGFAPNNKNYNIDWNAVSGSPGINDDVGALNALIGGISDYNSKLTSDTVGQLINAGRLDGSTRNVVRDVKAKIDAKAREAGLDPWETQYLQVNENARKGRISRDEADAQLNELDFQYKKNAYAKGGKAYGAASSNPSGEIRRPKRR